MQLLLPLHEEVPVPKEKPRPPIAFNNTCKNCEIQMERMYCHYLTRRKPFATFQCPNCKLRLFLFEAPVTPLLVWSSKTRKHADHFSEFIDELIEQRERKRKVNELRYGQNKPAATI